MTLATVASLMDSFLGNNTLVPLGVLLMVAIILLRRSTQLRQRQIRGKRSAEVSPAKVADRELSDERVQMRRNMESLLIELQELSRKINAEIDTRYAKLEAAIQDADRRIAALSRLSRSSTAEKSEKPSTDSDHAVRHAIIYELADAGFTPVEIAKDLGKSTGEVELILNLRRSTTAANPTTPAPADNSRM